MKKVKVTTKPIITEIEDVNRISFHVFFPIKYKRGNLANRIMVERMLNIGSNVYNTPEKLHSAYDNLFILRYGVSSNNVNNYDVMHFKLSVPKENIIDSFSLEKAIEFFHEMIFNPIASKGKFNDKVFEYERSFLLDKTKGFPKTIDEFAYDKYNELIDPKEENGVRHNTYVKLLKKVTSKSAYDYYRDSIRKNNYFTFISGAIGDRKELIKLFTKYFKQEYKELNYNFKFFNIDKITKYKEVEHDSKYNQSMLFLHYNIKRYREEEYLIFGLFGYILDSRENNLLFHKLRVDNNLIYTYTFYKTEKNGYFDIILYLDYEDIDKAKSLINEVFDSIKDEKTFNKCKNRTIKAMTYDLLTVEDQPFNKEEELLNDTLHYSVSLKEKIEIMKNISYDDMMKFMNRLVQSKTMIIKAGDNHE